VSEIGGIIDYWTLHCGVEKGEKIERGDREDVLNMKEPQPFGFSTDH
jgi:hypothetical protein